MYLKEISSFEALKVIKSKFLYSLYYAKVCSELEGFISTSLRSGNTVPAEEMSHRWRAVATMCPT